MLLPWPHQHIYIGWVKAATETCVGSGYNIAELDSVTVTCNIANSGSVRFYGSSPHSNAVVCFYLLICFFFLYFILYFLYFFILFLFYFIFFLFKIFYFIYFVIFILYYILLYFFMIFLLQYIIIIFLLLFCIKYGMKFIICSGTFV